MLGLPGCMGVEYRGVNRIELRKIFQDVNSKPFGFFGEFL